MSSDSCSPVCRSIDILGNNFPENIASNSRRIFLEIVVTSCDGHTVTIIAMRPYATAVRTNFNISIAHLLYTFIHCILFLLRSSFQNSLNNKLDKCNYCMETVRCLKPHGGNQRTQLAKCEGTDWNCSLLMTFGLGRKHNNTRSDDWKVLLHERTHWTKNSPVCMFSFLWLFCWYV